MKKYLAEQICDLYEGANVVVTKIFLQYASFSGVLLQWLESNWLYFLDHVTPQRFESFSWQITPLCFQKTEMFVSCFYSFYHWCGCVYQISRTLKRNQAGWHGIPWLIICVIRKGGLFVILRNQGCNTIKSSSWQYIPQYNATHPHAKWWSNLRCLWLSCLTDLLLLLVCFLRQQSNWQSKEQPLGSFVIVLWVPTWTVMHWGCYSIPVGSVSCWKTSLVGLEKPICENILKWIVISGK